MVNEKEANTIKALFKTYLLCGTLGSTVKIINDDSKHATKNGGNFDARNIKRLLKSRIYLGEKEYKGHVIPVPQIIDTETFDRVQLKIGDSKGYRQKRKHVNPLQSIAKCACCGGTISLQASGHTDKYRCSKTMAAANQRKPEDKCLTASVNHINNVLVDVIRYAHEMTGVQIGVGFKEEIKGKILELQSYREAVTTKLSKLEGRVNRAKNLYLDEYIEREEFQNIKLQSEKDRGNLETELNDLADRISQLYERLGQFVNNNQSIEHLSNPDNLASYCKSLRIEIEHLNDNSKLAKAFYGYILLKKPDTRSKLFRMKVASAMWSLDVVCVTRKTMYAVLMPEKPVEITVAGKKIRLTTENPFFDYSCIFPKLYTYDKRKLKVAPK